MMTLKDVEVLSQGLQKRHIQASVRDICACCKIVKHHYILDRDRLQARLIKDGKAGIGELQDFKLTLERIKNDR